MIPRALERCPARLVLETLLESLDEEDVLLRLRVAQTAARLIDRAPDARLDAPRVHSWVEHVLEAEGEIMDAAFEGIEVTGLRSIFGSDPRTPDREPRLELTFTLLSLTHPLEVIRAAAHGVQRSEPKLRGTALEYLETTLPTVLFRRVFERVRQAGEAPPVHREGTSDTAGERIADELLETSRQIIIPRPADDG